ncbi:MAG TPA: hypothetical protein VMV98_01750 [Acidobacteriaceae bacterium]|nr:hypothetical protein [Acidobacteriaceae bacterium]
MSHLALHALALARLDGLRMERGGIFPMLLVAAAIGVVAWAFARRDPVKN